MRQPAKRVEEGSGVAARHADNGRADRVGRTIPRHRGPCAPLWWAIGHPTFVGWRGAAPGRQTPTMARGLTAERVRRDVEVVARAGLDIDTFLTEAVESLQRAVPHVAACLATVDPSTQLLTSTRKFGDLRGKDDHDHEWGFIEYGTVEPTGFWLRPTKTTVGVPWPGM